MRYWFVIIVFLYITVFCLDTSTGRSIPSKLMSRNVAINECETRTNLSYKYMITFRKWNDNQEAFVNFCDGTLLNEYWVLTAGHCFSHQEGEIFAEKYKKIVQRLYRGPSEALKLVHYWISHPKYQEGTTLYHNVAVVKLTTAFLNAEYVKLPSGELPGSLFNHLISHCPYFTLMGWNAINEANPFSDKLNCVDVTLVPNDDEECKSSNLTTEEFCLKHESSDQWFGDAGGPVLCNDIQYGIICMSKREWSFRYQRIDTNLDFIHFQIKSDPNQVSPFSLTLTDVSRIVKNDFSGSSNRPSRSLGYDSYRLTETQIRSSVETNISSLTINVHPKSESTSSDTLTAHSSLLPKLPSNMCTCAAGVNKCDCICPGKISSNIDETSTLPISTEIPTEEISRDYITRFPISLSTFNYPVSNGHYFALGGRPSRPPFISSRISN